MAVVDLVRVRRIGRALNAPLPDLVADQAAVAP
jgi:hypothetical protein